MWIETQSGAYVSSNHVLMVDKVGVPEPGSISSDLGYAEGMEWRVLANLTTGDRVYLAAGLTEAEANALMPRILSGIQYAKYISVRVEIQAVRLFTSRVDTPEPVLEDPAGGDR